MCDKVKQLPGTLPTISFAQKVRDMVAELPSQLEFHRTMAKIRRQYYLDCVNEGFTKDQAFALCKDLFKS